MIDEYITKDGEIVKGYGYTSIGEGIAKIVCEHPIYTFVLLLIVPSIISALIIHVPNWNTQQQQQQHYVNMDDPAK